MSRRSPTSRRYLPVLITCLGLAAMASALAWVQCGRPLIGIDDANITFVYARNLAQGQGLVFHPGGEHVEGFSSPLWTLLCAAGFLLFKGPEPALLLVNVFLLAITLTCVYRFVAREEDAWRAARSAAPRAVSLAGVVAVVWLLAAPGFVGWNVLSLMETGCLTLILVLATVRALAAITEGPVPPRWSVSFTFLLVLLVLARPEGIAWALTLATAVALGRWLLDRDVVAAAASVVAPVFSVLGATGLIVLFRLLYFGHPLPNTYYAKVAPSPTVNLTNGAHYLGAFLRTSGVSLVALAAAVLGVGLLARSMLRTGKRADDDLGVEWARFSVLSVVVLLGFALPVLVGGDHFALHRLYQPLRPLLAMCVVAGLGMALKRLGRRGPGWHLSKAAVAALILIAGLDIASDTLGWTRLRGQFRWGFGIAESQRNLGSTLNLLFANQPLPSVGVIVAGGFAFSYRGETIDLLGLNNVEMAHSAGPRLGPVGHAAFNDEVFYRLQPQILHLYYHLPSIINLPPGDPPTAPAGASRDNPFLRAILAGLLDEPRFVGTYAPALISRPGIEPYYFFAIVRRDYAAELEQRGFIVHRVPFAD